MSFKLIENGDVFTPEPIGIQSVLLDGDKILKIGPVNAQKMRELEFDLTIINAQGCYVVPGLIDPHSHVLGAGGEEGFTSCMPEVQYSQIIHSGIIQGIEAREKGRAQGTKRCRCTGNESSRGEHLIKDGENVQPSQEETQAEESTPG